MKQYDLYKFDYNNFDNNKYIGKFESNDMPVPGYSFILHLGKRYFVQSSEHGSVTKLYVSEWNVDEKIK